MRKILLGVFFVSIIFLVVSHFNKQNNIQKNNTINDEIIVSIKPIHSMVCALTNGITTPQLLLDGTFSPHSFQIKPSIVTSLKKAKLVIWIGNAYEAPLAKHLKNLENHVLTLQNNEKIQMKSMRKGILWEAHCNDDSGHSLSTKDCCTTHNHEINCAYSEADGHLWLDPDMMLLMLEDIEKELKTIYPKHKEKIIKNAERYKLKLKKLKQDILQKLNQYHSAEYIIQHDGTQYFDAAFNTRAVATIAIEPGMPVSAGHIIKIIEAVTKKIIAPKCFFSEEQIDDNLINGYANKVGLPVKKLDYLGAKVQNGDTAYEDLMHNFADDMIDGFNKKIN